MAVKPNRMRFPGVVAPPTRLSQAEEEKLSARQRTLLDGLETLIMSERVSDYTMAKIAKRMNCSLQTLYAISSSKDELLLIVADRRLRRIGRAALQKLEANMPPMAALQTYLRATNMAVQPDSLLLQRNLLTVTGFQQMALSHHNFMTDIVQHLLDRAVVEGEIQNVDTHAIAILLGRLGGLFAEPEIAESLEESPGQTADNMADIFLSGLTAVDG